MENNENINNQEAEPSTENLIKVSLPASGYSKRQDLNLELKAVIIPLRDLNINASIYGLFGINLNEYYNKAFKHFDQCYDRLHVALIDNEFCVLSNREVVIAAK